MKCIVMSPLAVLSRFGVAIAAVAPFWGGAAHAQDCSNPQCGRDMSPACLERVAAGAIAAGDDCEAQNAAYLACLRDVAERCGAGPQTPSANACGPEDARAEWARLQSSQDVEQLEILSQVCNDTLQGRLAATRAARLRAAAELRERQGGGAGDGADRAAPPIVDATTPREEPPVDAGPTRAEIRAAQRDLTRLGFNPGVADGVWGRRSASALRAFQRDRGFAVTGELSDPIMAALRTAPTPTPPAAPARASFDGMGMAVYFRDTPSSRADADALRGYMERNGATIEYYDPIAAVCDLDGVDVSKTNVATKPGNPTPAVRRAVVEYLRGQGRRDINFHEWQSSNLDVFVSFCGDPATETAPPPVSFEGMGMAVYYRDTARSKADADALRAFMESRGATIHYYDPIAAVCDLDGVDMGRTNVATKPGNPTPEVRGAVVDYLQGQGRQINFHEWQSSTLDVFVSFCAD